MKLTHTLFSVLGATLLAASSAHAEKFAVSGWSPPNHVMTVEIHQAWADAMRKGTNGKIDFDVFSAGALLPPLSTMQGIRDGVAQAGHVAAPYHPAEFPVNNLVGDIGHSVGDTLVLAAAYLDFSMNDPVGFKEWRDNGNLPINAVATPLNRYICRSVIRTLDANASVHPAVAGPALPSTWVRFPSTCRSMKPIPPSSAVRWTAC